MNSLMAVALAMVVLSHPSDSHAVTRSTTAAAACKSALPVYDGNIRSRPLAIQNEGTSNAFVTCAQQNLALAIPDVRSIGLWVIHTGTMGEDPSIVISCTMVDGTDRFNTTYESRTATLMPGGIGVALYWGVPTTELRSFQQAISCNLPPNAGIARILTESDT